MKDKNILITGGTGVLGIYIVETLLAEGFENIEVFSRGGSNDSLSFADHPNITFTKGDIAELHPLTEAIERSNYIIHAAAIVSFHPKKFDLMHSINVEGTTNVVNIALDANVKKMIHISSIAAIGRSKKSDIISESTTWSNSRYNSYYGITKYLAEQEVWRAHHEGLNMVIINPSLIMGGKTWNQSSLQIFKKVYDTLPYYTTGSTGIVDVQDIAKMTLFLLKSDINGERYIASGGNISYKDLFQKMASFMGRKAPQKSAPKWIMSIFWRLEKVRSFLSGKEPIITRETIRSSSHISKYDNQKSIDLGWGEYTGLDETLQMYCKEYRAFRKKG
ncbi:MAG: dihydroflavonol-4-reductase [Saprospiraceae bacterium]